VITDNEYPVHVVKGLCRKIAYDFKVKYPPSAWASATKDTPLLSMPEFPELIKKYQNPEEADNIVKIQKELDETKTVLHKTIESVLERGEKIDNLVAKSDDLSAQSKMFYTQVRTLASARLHRQALTLSCRPRSRILVASLCEYGIGSIGCCTAFSSGLIVESSYVPFCIPSKYVTALHKFCLPLHLLATRIKTMSTMDMLLYVS
jgi:hypothetical protein|tara:strand:+ start:55942 stop:56556 length:615 start_codon:yes stop_codon:yes gene_type:complete